MVVIINRKVWEFPSSFPRRRPFDRLTVLSEAEGESSKADKGSLDSRLRGNDKLRF